MSDSSKLLLTRSPVVALLAMALSFCIPAIARGVRYNLAAIESGESARIARGQRLLALSRLLPQVSIGAVDTLAVGNAYLQVIEANSNAGSTGAQRQSSLRSSNFPPRLSCCLQHFQHRVNIWRVSL